MIVGDASSSFRAVAGPLSSEMPSTVIPDLTEEKAKALKIEKPLAGRATRSRFGMNSSGDITGEAVSTGF